MHIPELSSQVELLGNLLSAKKYTLGTAESCTGGLISSMLTDVSGSSAWFIGAVVAYSNTIKQAVLHVPEDTLIAHGAVSEETALAMVSGARNALDVDIAVSVTGIAGPTGGTPDKPVGTVWIGYSIGTNTFAQHHIFEGTRSDVRYQTAFAAITTLLQEVDKLSAK